MNSALHAVSPPARFGVRRDGSVAHLPLSMAFQPIVDVACRSVFAYEALVRGIDQESANDVLGQITEESRTAFDQSCRIKAMILATQLGIAEQGALLSVNFLPGAVYSPSACIQRTILAAEWTGFPLSSLMFEISEMETVGETTRLQEIAAEYRKHGLILALDDFGAGHSGLNLLADLDVHMLKLDGHLVRGIDHTPRTEEIVRATTAMCQRLGVQVVAECVETRGEYDLLRDCGIHLMQGFLFARPTFEALPEIIWPDDRSGRSPVTSINGAASPERAVRHGRPIKLPSVA
ncbi:MAG TPA: EAL domain-containing protein [Acidobacteriaceae bacterium]|nr:EAL domain-containing protein [Acidobacteriaceae bacterium]